MPTFLGLFNSSPVRLLAAVGNGALEAEGGGGANSYEVGIIKNIVVPVLPVEAVEAVGSVTSQIVRLKQRLDTWSPETRVFISPVTSDPADQPSQTDTVERQLSVLTEKIDELVNPLYGFTGDDIRELVSTLMPRGDELDDEEVSYKSKDEVLAAHDRLSWEIGTVFGRWDIRFATGERPVPELPDPFAPLPICPPGMLQNDKGLPIGKDDLRQLQATGEWNYPLEITWDGILVDDPGPDGTQPHRDDIVRRVREVLTVIWKDRAEAIEHEACEILGAKELREYFRKPTNFFADHLKRYSKSRRQAPIYWPLSTASSSYTLWIYYHRLNEDTLYTALNQYVKPKIHDVERQLGQIESALPNATAREASRLRDAFEDTKTFLEELGELRDELDRVAGLPYKPNLNDGVLITASPLWKLFRLPKWRKDLEACGKKLEKGDYDWTHLAYSIWPDRVREVCKKDRSIAIAHGLEDLCEVKPTAPKKKRGKKRKAEPEMLLQEQKE